VGNGIFFIYREDFELITKIYEKRYIKNEVFHMADILDVIERDPKLKEINQGLERNIEYNKERSKRSESKWT
jgi:spore coat polysaccharide biosynthesis protein SpsF (cytidylyltransferase family)